MRIYLTGASGFVGSNLAHAFAYEHGEVSAPPVELPDLSTMLGRLRAEVESSWSLA